LKSKILIFVALTGLIVASAGCDKRTNLRQVKDTRADVMGTFVSIVAVAGSEGAGRGAISFAFAELDRIDGLMSDYKDDSQLSVVNRQGFDRAVEVGSELFFVLARSVEYSEISDGAFDVTVGPVVDLWRKAGEEGRKPSAEELSRAKEKTGYKKLLLDRKKKTVRFAVDGMRIDLGAIAKGYAIDRAVEAMKAAGAVGGLVDVGGDIRCFGKPARKSQWVIGLQDPDVDRDILLALGLVNMSVATSGDYRRFVVVDGEKYGHIMNPASGSSVRDFASVSVIAPSAIDADALATVVSVVGAVKGLDLIESLSRTEALLLPSDSADDVQYTSGFERYIISYQSD
jgi:thiamine biosynthesis lipoprotein